MKTCKTCGCSPSYYMDGSMHVISCCNQTACGRDYDVVVKRWNSMN